MKNFKEWLSDYLRYIMLILAALLLFLLIMIFVRLYQHHGRTDVQDVIEILPETAVETEQETDADTERESETDSETETAAESETSGQTSRNPAGMTEPTTEPGEAARRGSTTETGVVNRQGSTIMPNPTAKEETAIETETEAKPEPETEPVPVFAGEDRPENLRPATAVDWYFSSSSTGETRTSLILEPGWEPTVGMGGGGGDFDYSVHDDDLPEYYAADLYINNRLAGQVDLYLQGEVAE